MAKARAISTIRPVPSGSRTTGWSATSSSARSDKRALDGLGLVGRRPAAEAEQIAEQRAVAALAHAMRDHEVLAHGHLSEELESLERAREPEAAFGAAGSRA